VKWLLVCGAVAKQKPQSFRRVRDRPRMAQSSRFWLEWGSHTQGAYGVLGGRTLKGYSQLLRIGWRRWTQAHPAAGPLCSRINWMAREFRSNV